MNFESDIEPEIVPKGKTWSLKYKLTDKSFFGGILIRQIQEINGEKRVLDGPLKVAELFRVLDATSKSQNNPILTIPTTPLNKIEFENKERHNLLGNKKDIKAKVIYNINQWFSNSSDLDEDDLQEKLAKFAKNIEYRYIYCK